MSAQNETVYIKADRNKVVNKKDVQIGDSVKLYCKDKNIQSKLRTLHLYTFQKQQVKHKKAMEIVSILKIIELILKEYPNITIENLGEVDFVLEYVEEGNIKLAWHWTKTIFTSAAIFFGSAFTIMTFNNDVSVPAVFEKMYKLTVGKPSNGFTALEISYSIGMAIGILMYFNHIGNKKVTADPTPIQVQMRKYEQDVDTTFIEESSRKESNLDVS